MLTTIGKQFKKPTGVLGRVASVVMKKGNMIAYDRLIEMMNIGEDDVLFEVGYGHGKRIKDLVINNNVAYSGIDFSKLMYNEATKANKPFIIEGRVRLSYGDFMDCSMPSAKYDKVFCVNVIYFWDDLLMPFTKIKAALKPKGKFYFFMARPEDLLRLKFTKDGIFNKYTMEMVESALRNAGFRHVEYQQKEGYYVKAW